MNEKKSRGIVGVCGENVGSYPESEIEVSHEIGDEGKTTFLVKER